MVRRKAMIGKVGSRLLIVLLAVCLAVPVGARKRKKPKLNQIEEVKFEQVEGINQVVITTTVPATYSIYRPLEPIRIMVDIADAKVSKGVPAQIEVNNGIINLIKTSTIKGERTSIARVEIGLDKMMSYEVEREENKLLVKIRPEEKAEEEKDLYKTSEGKLIVEKTKPEEKAPEAQPGATVQAEAIEEEAEAPAEAPAVSAGATVAEIPSKPAKKLLDIVVSEEKDRTNVILVMDGLAPDYHSFQLKNPPRLVLDLWKIKSLYPSQKVKINSQGIKQVRLGQHTDKLRLVFDGLGKSLPNYNISKENERIIVTFSVTVEVAGPPSPPLAAPVIETAPAPTAPVEEVAPSAEVAPAPAVPAPELPRVVGVDFKYTRRTSKVIIKSDQPLTYEKKENPQDLIFSLIISGAKIAPELERSLDTTEFQSPINLISSFQASDKDVNIVVNLNQWVEPEVKQEGNRIEISFANPSAELVPPEAEAPPTPPAPAGEEISAPEASPAPAPSAVPAPSVPAGQPVKVETLTGTKIYTGTPITIEAKNLDILDALRAIAEVSGLNIIAADNVKGNITLKLENVPWDQALDLILETKGLGMVRYGNIIRVAPLKDIQKEQEEKLKSIEQRQKLKPLQTRIVPINYAKADDIARQVKTILSDRGMVQVDKRTNSLIIKDVPEKIQEAQVLISSLDTRTPQVLIEARIVEATVGVSRELGIQWGFNYNVGPAWGNPTGLNFPNTIQVGGAVLGGQIDPVSATILNTAGAQGGAIGIKFGSLTDAISLDLLLKSLETQNKIKIISSPRILTMDNQKATIQQGVTIPYPPAINLATGAAGGAQWQFVEAALRLEVTPHVSPDGTIVLDVKASNNEPNLKVVSGGAPSIDKKEAQTKIIVKDGETVVIGGIYKTKESETTNQTPFLAKIPVIGKLFQDRFVEKSRTELLIFLTPRIVK